MDAATPPAKPTRSGPPPPLALDSLRREVRIGEHTLVLRAKEFELLSALTARPGEVLSREEILADVWGFKAPGRTRTVDAHVTQLRRRLAGTGFAIRTVRAVGYALVPAAMLAGETARLVD